MITDGEIATEKNFTKASELLYLSQPSLSKQLKTLEKNLDVLPFNIDFAKDSDFWAALYPFPMFLIVCLMMAEKDIIIRMLL